jgi:hypothetical protein
MRLTQLYNVVNSQIYYPKDTLALNLGKSKTFPDRKRIIDFGKYIGVKKCEDIVDEMAEQIRDELELLTDHTEAMELDIKSTILENIYKTTTRTATKTRAARKHTKHTS